MKAVDAVLSDDGFEVESPYTAAALKVASDIKKWHEHPENHTTLELFSHVLVLRLKACFTSKHKTMQLKRESMWGAYHRLRASDTFRRDWKTFLHESFQVEAFPAFYQFVTHHMFKELLKMEYPLPEVSTNTCARPLTLEEKNALRYVAGYIVRKLQSTLESSSISKKDEMIYLLMELAGDELAEETGTELWTNMVDRGGLWHVNDQTYDLFATVEEEIRHFFTLRQHVADEMTAKEVITETILRSNDVQFTWSLIGADYEHDICSDVLRRIVNMYIAIRGFAFASSCLELYKQANKKILQKKRALRSELCPKD